MENRKNCAYQWFIEPGNGYMEKIIVDNLAEIINVDMSWSRRDDLGLPHKIYQIKNHVSSVELENAKAVFNLDFFIYSRRGKHDPIRFRTLDDMKNIEISEPEQLLLGG